MLLHTEPAFEGAEQLEEDLLGSAVRTEANRRIVLPKLYLHLWSLGKTLEADSSIVKRLYWKADKDGNVLREVKRFFMETAGEAPQLVDLYQLDLDAQNIQSIYFANGFFNANVRYVVKPLKSNPWKARVVFKIEEGLPYRIRSLTYETNGDEAIRELLEKTRSEAAVQAGDVYNEDALAAERDRINTLFKNEGYFLFNPAQISYKIDTTINTELDSAEQQSSNPINVFRPEQLVSAVVGDAERGPRRYRVLDMTMLFKRRYDVYTLRNFTIEILPNPGDTAELITIRPWELTPERRDSLGLPERRLYGHQPFIFRVTPKVIRILNLNTVAEQFMLLPGQPYDQSAARFTQRKLQELGVFGSVRVRFDEVDTLNKVDGLVTMTLLDRLNFRVGLESFQSEDVRLNTNLPGFGVNFQFSKRNAFKRGERLSARLNGTVSFYRPDQEADFQYYYQYGGELNLSFPRLLLVYPLVKDWKHIYSPSTSIGLNYNFENPVEFQRSTAAIDFTFNWLHNQNMPQWRSSLTLLQLSIVNSQLDSSFQQRVSSDVANDPTVSFFILRDFQPRFISQSSYYLTYTDFYGQSRSRLTTFLRPGMEFGGNLPYLVDVIGRTTEAGDGDLTDALIGGTQYYGQFYKLSLEGRAFLPLSEKAELVARAILGYAHGWNYTAVIPFENRFFAGGTNSVRGWQANTLGPGTFPGSANSVIALGGEYKAEFSLEFRRDLISYLEGALFIDAGNVWFSENGGFDDPRGKLSRETLHLGVAGGAGIRVDLDFLVIRLDIGQQLYSPVRKEAVVYQWDDLGGNRIQYNLAIGYPF